MHNRVEAATKSGNRSPDSLNGLHATTWLRVSVAEETGSIANYVGLIPTTMESGPANGWT